MIPVCRNERVVDKRKPELAGTALDGVDPITKLVRVRWDNGKRSIVFAGVLAPEGSVRRRGMKEAVA